MTFQTSIDQKNSVSHSAVLFANSLFQAGTTNDSFLRDQFEWIVKSSHWAKFNLVASLGVIHRNNHKQAMDLLKPYFPNQNGKPNFYAHGGAMFALGLINAKTKDQSVINFLIENIQSPSNNQNEQIIHGACFGLGFTGLGSGDMKLYEVLKNILFTNSATTGEAAGLAIGMVLAGAGQEVQNENIYEELLSYAKETEHEKIIRSIAMSLAIMMFGKEESADQSIDELANEQDPILRFGAMYMIAMAYVGTNNNKAIKKLLHFASSDVSDDVRRAAVISLAFILINNHTQVPRIMKLLIMSYNPHVRYGAALALGISCAGKNYNEAITMLQPMLNDTIDFVRQGAMIGMSLVLQQSNDTMEPRVKEFKKQLKESYSKKHEDVLCKMGALISTSILESGGRNSILNINSRNGSLKLGATLGTLFFTHYWYWFSSIHFLSLALTPSALIGVDCRLQIPQSFEFKCNAAPSQFGYPPEIKAGEQDQKKETVTVQLSTTNKAKGQRVEDWGLVKAYQLPLIDYEIKILREFRCENYDFSIEVYKFVRILILLPNLSYEWQVRAAKKGAEKEMEIEKPKENEEKIEEEKKEEPTFSMMKNPSRILEKQQSYIQFLPNRYTPIIQNRKKGIIFLKDSQIETADDYFGVEKKQQVNENMPIIEEEKISESTELKPPQDFVFQEE